MVNPKEGRTVIKNINGYEVEISKRIYPEGIYNYCYLLLDCKKIALGELLGDMEKKDTLNTLKSLIKTKLLYHKYGRKLIWNIFKNNHKLYFNFIEETALNENFLIKADKFINKMKGEC